MHESAGLLLKKDIKKNEKKNNNQSTIIKPACVYRAENKCLPPDSNTIIDIECKKCHFYVKLLSDNEIDKLLTSLYNGFEEIEGKKIKHPLDFDKDFFLKEFLISAKLTEITGKQYTSTNIQLNTDDYISQIIHNSVRWQYTMRLNIDHTSGMSGGIHWHTIPFERPYTFFQKKILMLSLAYMQFYSEYRKLFLCKSCLDNDLRSTIVNKRERNCESCNADLRLQDTKYIRYYFAKGGEKDFVSDEDFGIFSIVEWYTEKYRKFSRQRENRKYNKDSQK